MRSSDYSYRLAERKLQWQGVEKVKRGSETQKKIGQIVFEERRQGRRRQPERLRYGSGRRPLQSIHAHTTAVSDPKAPATSPMVRGPTYCDAIPAADIDTIMTLQRMDSMVLNTRPRNWSGVRRSSCALLSTLVTAIPTRENIMNTSAAA